MRNIDAPLMQAREATLRTASKWLALDGYLRVLDGRTSSHNKASQRLLELSKVLKRTIDEIDRELTDGFVNED